MEYTIAKLAQLSGVTTRTLRYYDQIGLLCPVRVSNGYRIYGQKEVDLLQQILFYRELGVELKEIEAILKNPDFDRERALEIHLLALQKKKMQLEKLIENVTKTIGTLKGDVVMSDKEKFEGFKDKMIKENEERYGEEIRQKYGDDVVDASNARVKGMDEEKMQLAESLRERIDETLKAAFEQGNPAGELAKKACEMHRQWICMFWPEGMYSREAHVGLADMYVADERFRAYYDRIAPGCAEFLRDAIYDYCINEEMA